MAREQDKDTGRSTRAPLGPAGWIALMALFGFLVWAIWYAVHAWGLLAGVGMSVVGWLFLVLSVVFTIGVGAGLMALLFYSSRKGRDF
ncbi:MAG TPA: hypothetical protein VII49_02065 [Rhizomicrobium sp.]